MPPELAEQVDWFSTQLLPHEPLLRSWLNRRFPDADNIDDIIQDAYLRVLKKSRSMTIESPKSFLFATARNLALDHLRSHKISRKVALVDSESSIVLDPSDEPPVALARKQERLILREAIQSLPDRCREIFILHKINEMPPREIAEKLGLSTQTVSNQLYKGLSRCTQYVERYRKEWKGEGE
jgi:RNA polymerase sigma factor (sigma-70 family)